MRSTKTKDRYYLKCATHHIAKNACEGAFISVKALEDAVLSEIHRMSKEYLDIETLEKKESKFEVLYPDEMSLEDKIKTIATKIYGADDVTYSPAAKKALAKITEMGFGNLPVCMAKNQYSLSDDQTKLGRPTGFNVNIREVYVSAGAGFVVAITGAIMTMPGLPKKPAAFNIDVNNEGVIEGLF